MKLHSLRENPHKPSVVKDQGIWWATVRNETGLAISTHGSQPEAFTAAQRMAGADQ
jgi:hypothetical protein